jgi:hypothetical protein
MSLFCNVKRWYRRGENSVVENAFLDILFSKRKLRMAYSIKFVDLWCCRAVVSLCVES